MTLGPAEFTLENETDGADTLVGTVTIVADDTSANATGVLLPEILFDVNVMTSGAMVCISILLVLISVLSGNGETSNSIAVGVAGIVVWLGVFVAVG